MEDAIIMEKVKQHSNYVTGKIKAPQIMTMLIGSQNYQLDTENSDIDTVTFVFPTSYDIVFNKKPVSSEFNVSDGKCVVKDIRLAFDLLRKPSPNSIEWFITKYKYYNPLYENILKYYLENQAMLFLLTHANYKTAIAATVGAARGYYLRGNNISDGKKVANVLRLKNFILNYLDEECNPKDYFLFKEDELQIARAMKNEKENSSFFIKNPNDIIDELLGIQQNFSITEKHHINEKNGTALINNFQEVLFNKYFNLIIG